MQPGCNSCSPRDLSLFYLRNSSMRIDRLSRELRDGLRTHHRGDTQPRSRGIIFGETSLPGSGPTARSRR